MARPMSRTQAMGSSMVEINSRLPGVNVVAAGHEIRPAYVEPRGAQEPTPPIDLNVRRFIGFIIMVNENVRTKPRSQTPELIRKVRSHRRGPKARFPRIINQHLGSPRLKLRRGYNLPGVLLDVIKLPDRFA